MSDRVFWEEFPVGPGEANTELHVTINRKGEILIGARAFERLGRCGHAVLMYDRKNKRIGVFPLTQPVKNSFPLKGGPGSRHRTIRASRFVRHYGIVVPVKTCAFNWPEIANDGMLILDMKDLRSACLAPKLRVEEKGSGGEGESMH